MIIIYSCNPIVVTYRSYFPKHKSPAPEHLIICTGEFILSGCGRPGQYIGTTSGCQAFAQRRTGNVEGNLTSTDRRTCLQKW